MRPIILVTDPPDPEALSTRKLVLESAKYNVLTSFTGGEALEIANKIPIDVAVIHQNLKSEDVEEVVGEIKRVRPQIPVIVVSPEPEKMVVGDHVLNSHDPVGLVNLICQLVGAPDSRPNAIV
jgi:DNA-binding response OmpR family regulator